MRKEIEILSAMTIKKENEDVTRRPTPRDRESRRETELEEFTTSLRQAKNTLAVEAGKVRERVPEIFRTLLRQAKSKNAVQNLGFR
jgi:hypothetical protein